MRTSEEKVKYVNIFKFSGQTAWLGPWGALRLAFGIQMNLMFIFAGKIAGKIFFCYY